MPKKLWGLSDFEGKNLSDEEIMIRCLYKMRLNGWEKSEMVNWFNKQRTVDGNPRFKEVTLLFCAYHLSKKAQKSRHRKSCIEAGKKRRQKKEEKIDPVVPLESSSGWARNF